MLESLQQLSGGAAAFVGALTGSATGLVAIILGALFNAHLNRKRDDRLRMLEARSVATALIGELNSLAQSLLGNAENLTNPQGDFMMPDIVNSIRILPEIAPKLGLFDTETVKEVVDAYTVIDQYSESLLLLGGRLHDDGLSHRRILLMPKHRAENVVAMNRNMAKFVQRAQQKLDPYTQ